MATHITRKELKHDVVAETVEHQIDWFAHHKPAVTRYGTIAVVLVAVVWGGWSYRNYQIAQRQAALGAALAVQVAPIGTAPGGGMAFATEQARDEAARKAFAKVMTEQSGSQEAYLAQYYLAGMDADAGKLDDALKKYQDVAANSSAEYASIAKLAIAQLQFAQGKVNEGRATLKDLAPTSLVSKEQIDVTLAKGIAATQPDEARKLLTPLAGKAGSEIAQVAATALGDIQK